MTGKMSQLNKANTPDGSHKATDIEVFRCEYKTVTKFIMYREILLFGLCLLVPNQEIISSYLRK